MSYDKKIHQIDWALALALNNLPYIPIKLACSIPFYYATDKLVGTEIITHKPVIVNQN